MTLKGQNKPIWPRNVNLDMFVNIVILPLYCYNPELVNSSSLQFYASEVVFLVLWLVYRLFMIPISMETGSKFNTKVLIQHKSIPTWYFVWEFNTLCQIFKFNINTKDQIIDTTQKDQNLILCVINRHFVSNLQF